MSPGQWFRAPRRLLLAFLVLVLLPAAALAWLGVRFLEQQRDLVDQEIRGRLDSAADLLEESLGRARSDLMGLLATWTALPPERLESALREFPLELNEAVVVQMTADSLTAYPPEHLIFYPECGAAEAETSRGVFETAEELEFRSRSHLGAAAEFRRISRSTDPPTKSRALNGWARNLRKAGHLQEALTVYRRLEEQGNSWVNGLPAELLARNACIELLRDIKMSEAESEAKRLFSDLRRGRWRLSRAAYLFHAQQLTRSGLIEGCQESGPDVLLALATGVEQAWTRWQRFRQEEGAGSGFSCDRLAELPVLLAWHAANDRLVALVGAPGYLEQKFLTVTAPALSRYRAKLTLTDSAGRSVAGESLNLDAHQVIARVANEKIPWNLHLAAADPEADFAELADRQRLVLSALVLLALAVLGGGYLVSREIFRELETARLQSSFVDAVSHQFRTPLTIMRQLTEMLAGGRLVSEARRQKYYDVLASETSRLQRLVESLLSFGRLEAGMKEYRFESVDLVALTQAVVREFRKEAGEQGYQVALDDLRTGSCVRADPEALQRALWNLLDNAVKYSPDHKTIRVQLEDMERSISLKIRDQGLGISLAERNKVFRKFVRGEAAQSTGVKGTGIGLAMVRHIVRGHGGWIRVESEPGRGSVFTIVLPKEK